MADTRTLTLVTSNPHKALEAQRILGIPLIRISLTLPEIQATRVEEIARHKLEAARAMGYRDLIVEDVSLGFDELGNFPGPYIRWLLEAAGGAGLAAIAGALRSRTARAECCIAHWDGQDVRVFLGETNGEIVAEPRGAGQFGWDAWFQPHGSAKTFAEMTPEEKDSVSHRGKAYRQLAESLRRAERSSVSHPGNPSMAP